MAKIRITPETLEAQAGQLDSMKQEHENVYQRIQKLINDLTSEWEGEANAAFMQSFRGNDAAFKKFSQDVESFRQRMMKAAQEMRAAEEQVKAKMQQM